jgi:hypothetical protein
MSKNIAAHQRKVEHSVRKILKAPGLSIPDAMVLANFSKKDVANETVRRAVHRAVKLLKDQELLDLCAPTTDGTVFGHEEVQAFPILLGLNNKGGMDDVEFFGYLQNPIMKLYPDTAPMKGKWVVIKSDSDPGTQEEFDKLAADRNELIVESSGDDHPNSDAPIPTMSWLSRCPIFSPPTNQLTRLGMMEELWGKKVGFSSVNSNKIMVNHVLMCSP